MTARLVAVIGAGIIGAAVAREISLRHSECRVTLFDKESQVAFHQTGHNSGVVHAGLYYEPGSLKARLCTEGAALVRNLAKDRDLPYDECGKLVIASNDAELTRLEKIYHRAVANQVPDVEFLDACQLKALEPGAIGVAALYSPRTAIVDYVALTKSLISDLVAAGGRIRLGTPVSQVEDQSAGVAVHLPQGPQRFDFAIVCAGLQSDRLARVSGSESDPVIVPFLGQYFILDPAYSKAVTHLVYPVPDPAYPFLGVHITRRIDGGLMIGPNAFLSFGREHYRGLGVSLRDTFTTATYPGFWRFAAGNIPAAWRELGGVLSMKRFVTAAAKYVPSLAHAKGVRGVRGIRAQAMTRNGELVDDFVIQSRGHAMFVRNAPSPAATASLAIARHLVDLAEEQWS